MIEYSNFLNIPALFELSCAAMGCLFKGKSFEQVKKDFALDNENFTPEDDENLIKEYPWIIDETHRKLKELDGAPPSALKKP